MCSPFCYLLIDPKWREEESTPGVTPKRKTIHKCKWDESKPNYNVFIKILKTCKDTEKMIALKNNRVDKWNSKWNKIYLWLVFRRIQIWSLWWFSFYVIWHYTNDGLLHCFHECTCIVSLFFYVFVRDMIV